jgi:hypothetical protein
MRFVWYISVILAFIQIITSISTAVINGKTVGGYKSAGFTSIWTLFLCLFYEYLTHTVIFKGRHDDLVVGFTIGLSGMLCQLFFMVSCHLFLYSARLCDISLRNKFISLLKRNYLHSFSNYLY